ncbi:single-stranded DNA-binding protein [Streptomyces sp. WMMC500]|uniref:single-stranded DNA-binding protein n=1 Tax=Streptomyces sp. WMMC500 TaxID=3015154 RepID=UPI00248BE130|nr:single-stranded DNA-binding protein [Streptomyces sp. WMMC500]WBB58472.1 single-stranded DNA-binding protein [Streptomyces sp. WMMC500]
MSFGETPITITGNLTADPEVKFTGNGHALAKFTVASTPRVFDRESNQWKDGTATFFRCAAWRSLAEHVADSLTKGTRVVLSGRIRQHNWETDQGEKRSMLAVEVDDIGASLRFTTVTINGRNVVKPNATDDPWATNADGKSGDEPPF